LLSLSSSPRSHSKSLYRRRTLDSFTLNTGRFVYGHITSPQSLTPYHQIPTPTAGLSITLVSEMTYTLSSGKLNSTIPYLSITLCPFSLHCTLASCSAVYCNRSCLWVLGMRACVCGWVCLFVRGSVTTITRNCMHRSSVSHQTGSVGKGSDHLQPTKFWPSHAPRISAG